MSREWSLISALGPTPVPVPQAIGFCESPDVTGAWFYVMGMVDGHPLYSAEDTSRWVPVDQRQKMARSFIDVLADLHGVDPDEVGLGDLGKKENYVGRQLKTWYRSWTSSVAPANYDDPRAHELQQFFLDNIPEQGPAPPGGCWHRPRRRPKGRSPRTLLRRRRYSCRQGTGRSALPWHWFGPKGL